MAIFIRRRSSKKRFIISGIAIILVIAVSILISNRYSKEKPVTQLWLTKLEPSNYPEFIDDIAYKHLKDSIGQSLVYLRRIPEGRTFKFGEDTVDAAHMIRSLEHFLNFIQKNPSPLELSQFIQSDYQVYKSIGRDEKGEVLFTGYFEPLLEGSLSESEEYPFPIYGPPDDMAVVDLSIFSAKLKGEKIIGRVEGKTFVPYYDRQEIEENGVLNEKATPLIWVKDRVALFFLHIQGSGKIALNNGETLNVHYHSKNGRPYRSIGQLLIDRKKISVAEMSMQKIREYLHQHPEEISGVLNHNPSYIFFSVEEEGPLGALNVRLTPERSIAVDRSIFPLSALAFIKTKKPMVDDAGHIFEWADCKRFMLMQDTGGAIRGAGRADFFWGNGEYAELAAGHMKHKGELYVLVLRRGK